MAVLLLLLMWDDLAKMGEYFLRGGKSLNWFWEGKERRNVRQKNGGKEFAVEKVWQKKERKEERCR